MKNVMILFTIFQLVGAVVFSAIQTRDVEYKEGDTTLEGFLAYDDSSAVKRPGILIVHEWTGLGDYVKSRAKELAGMGYVAFGADIYGKGIRPQNPKDAGEQASKYKNNRKLLRVRVLAGLEELKKDLRVDPAKTAAIGYCFGGTTVLELARSGADIQGVVSFHGGLDSPAPEDGKNIKARVLVLHGAADPFSSPENIRKFQDELSQAKVDWQMMYYGSAVHSFTNREAGNDPSKGAAYNEKADKRSWAEMKIFFRELFEK
ncbi:MAG: dienelactone hydrolase family protein [Candidatus Riflebacteria bacterium]|nr:dienelactone hydrolase family protein [Candidatus Riflebacteria bacterium]